MRRKDREVIDDLRIKEIISNCCCCRLGWNDNGKVYIVPLNFGFEKADCHYTFFFHSAAEGKKVDLIKAGGPVGFELDTNYMIHPAEKPCGYSAKFQSIIGTGNVSLITDRNDKAYALRKIMAHSIGKHDWDFPSVMLDKVLVFKLDVTELSCKEHK